MKLNGREYQLPDTFLYDLRVELGIESARVAAPLPGQFEREFMETISVTRPLRGLGVRTFPTPEADWIYERPDGSVCRMTVQVPDEALAQLKVVQMSSVEIIDAVYAATMPTVQAAFRADWGV